MVPVVRHAEARDLWDCAAELARLAEAARAGSATREELSGSTITITSLGALGGIVTTPVINHPEVAIVGVNKIAVRPVWDGAPVRAAQDDEPVVAASTTGWSTATTRRCSCSASRRCSKTPAMIFIEG